MKFLKCKYSIILLLFFCFGLAKSDAMIKALNTAATGMAAQEANVNTISNNIANANTIGFKKSRTEFNDLLYHTVQEAGARSSATTRYNVGIQTGSGAKVSSTRKVFTQGVPHITNNPFDIMINGEGFFKIILNNGAERFTRDGAFSVNAQGVIVTKSDYKLFPNITVPPNVKRIYITADGKIDAYFANQVEATNLGTVPVFTFVNPPALHSVGGNLYRATASSGAAIQNVAGSENAGVLQQGALESSNVNIMVEMTTLIKAQRAFEMNSKVMGVSDQMLQTINNIR